MGDCSPSEGTGERADTAATKVDSEVRDIGLESAMGGSEEPAVGQQSARTGNCRKKSLRLETSITNCSIIFS